MLRMANTEERGEAGGWESGAQTQAQERKDAHARSRRRRARQAQEQAPPALLLRTAQRELNAPRRKGPRRESAAQQAAAAAFCSVTPDAGARRALPQQRASRPCSRAEAPRSGSLRVLKCRGQAGKSDAQLEA